MRSSAHIMWTEAKQDTPSTHAHNATHLVGPPADPLELALQRLGLRRLFHPLHVQPLPLVLEPLRVVALIC